MSTTLRVTEIPQTPDHPNKKQTLCELWEYTTQGMKGYQPLTIETDAETAIRLGKEC